MTFERTHVPSAAKYADVGYSRAVRVGPIIEVAGTTSLQEDGSIGHPDDIFAQSLQVCEAIAEAVEHLGGTVSDLVRTRVFTVDIARWKEIGRAHAQVFGDTRPACTFVEVSKLVHPDMLVEIEASAVVRQ